MNSANVKPIEGKLTVYYDVKLLIQVLSPLEMIAWSHNYEPFLYVLDGQLIRFTKSQCRKLLSQSLHKLQFVAPLLHTETNNLLYKDREQFLNSPLIHHPLSNRFINGLFKVNCHLIQDVLNIGYRKLKNTRGVGIQSVREFEALLVKYKCRDLLK